MTVSLLEGGPVVTVDAQDTIYPEGGVVIDDDRIAAVGEADELVSQYDVDRRVDTSGLAVLPGFVNTHLHSGFIRGLAEDLPVFEWLTEHVDPTHRVLGREEARSAYKLCYAEMAMAGITCALDMYRYMDEAADVAAAYGLRTVLAPYVADRPEYDYFESIETNKRLVKERHGDADGRIRVWFGLEHLTYCTEEAYHRVADLADRYGVGIHTHGEESKKMAERLTDEHGKRPIELFHERGILGPKTVLAHCVWLEPEEIELIAETGTSVAHCPTSNMKLASGVAPVPELQAQGVDVGLGGDGIKENNRIDLIQEMKLAALLQKVDRLDATLLPAERVLRMGTIEGARALGLEEEIGSIEPGKRADLITIDLDRLHLSPVFTGTPSNLVANIVHAAQPSDIASVFVNGEYVVKDGVFLPDDRRAVLAEHKAMTERLLERRDELD